MSNDDLVVCRVCAQSWTGAHPGLRCPTGDGGVLIALAVHHAMPNDHFVGRAIAGKYAVVGKLGGGAMGAVYRALQEPVSRPVAIKVIDADAAMEGDLRARFFREARVVAQLTDPGVVTLYDYGQTDDGTLFMVFELLEGELLGDLLAREGALTPNRAVALMQPVLGALTEAHAMGLVHRDLKPDNIMVIVDRRGRETVKVLDFGIAKMRDQENDGVHTREGIVLGTPRYMSPEQAQDKDLDGRSDLYAVGVMLYEMLVGRPPFDGVAPLEVLLAHVREPVPPFLPEVGAPATLEAVVMRSLEKNRDHRYLDAGALGEALSQAIQPPAAEASTDGARLVPVNPGDMAPTAEISTVNVARPIVGLPQAQVGGSGGTAKAGSGGTPTAGSGANAKAGSGATAKAGSGATAKAGSGANAKAGSGATAKAGSGATAAAGTEPAGGKASRAMAAKAKAAEAKAAEAPTAEDDDDLPKKKGGALKWIIILILLGGGGFAGWRWGYPLLWPRIQAWMNPPAAPTSAPEDAAPVKINITGGKTADPVKARKAILDGVARLAVAGQVEVATESLRRALAGAPDRKALVAEARSRADLDAVLAALAPGELEGAPPEAPASQPPEAPASEGADAPEGAPEAPEGAPDAPEGEPDAPEGAPEAPASEAPPEAPASDAP